MPTTKSLSPGLRVLLVEDEPLIAIDTQDALVRFGVKEVVWARNLAEADAAIDAGGFHAAILDLRLGAESSVPLAHRLAALNVPFGFLTGFLDSGIPASLRQYPVVMKPCTHAQLGDLLLSLVSPTAP